MNTKAVVITAPHTVGLQDVTLKQLGPDDVLIETAYTSISAGTERMLLAGQMPHPMLQLPVIPGYETVGQITTLGEHVDAEWQGKWVYVGGAMCYDGINGAWGGQSAHLFTNVSRVIPLDGLDPRQGVMLALSATALHGVDLLNITADDRVVVIGQGPVGQIAARIAAVKGAWVAVTDRSPSRLALAEGNVVINVDNQPLNEAVAEPVNVIIEASGSMQALADALPLLANGGTILLLGYYTTLEIPYMPLFLKEAKLLTAKEWAPGDLLRCRDMIREGTLDVSPLLTHTLPITAVSEAYEVAMNDLDCLKLLLEWKV